MNSRKPRLPKRAKKRLLRRFTTIMLSTFVAGTAIVIGGLATYQHFNKDKNIFDGSSELSAEEKELEELEKLKTNVAVFGVDIDGYRTDAMFVAHLDGSRDSVDLVSIPRDTIVNLSDAEHQRLRSVNKHAPSRMKINEMTAYAGIENIQEFTMKEIERSLGIKLDNYVTVEIDAFRKIVDIMGGVIVDVPREMQYYDSVQGLSIDLQPGIQELDGAAAEGMVRWRKDGKGGGYSDGDVGRIQTQHIFLKAFAEQMLSKENIPKYPKMIPAMFKHVNTDINLLDLPKYYGYASKFDTNNLKFHTIPGKGEYLGPISYFFPDYDEMDDFIQKIFYKSSVTDLDEEDSNEIVEDKGVRIEILNGGAAAGTAGDLEKIIKRDGYNVVNVGNYKGEKQADIRIYAKDRKKAKQFEKYFDNCRIYEDSSIGNEVDIQIVIGSKGI